ncbi:MAG TPA: ATP-grasp domain-containing protein [Gemmatimonadales bacterium]|nr:ATP-grasp domain-containing protein [Gemmatimonadales bacterium]
MTRVLIVGVSTRGFAESAARAGYDVVAVDGFGDLDLRARAGAVFVARAGGRFSLRSALRRARALARDATCYVANLENHPRAVQLLSRDGALWGNRPAVLRAVRDPLALARALARRGLATPAARRRAPRERTGKWLIKPLASGGGSGVAPWQGGAVGAATYLQQRIGGRPGSVIFAADGRRAVVLGVSHALVGDPRFGAAGFRYCGSIVTTPAEPLRQHVTRLATAVTEQFGLVGVNGVDFVVANGVPYAVEVNPRYTASMELVERRHGLSIFETHVRACTGTLPQFDIGHIPRRDTLRELPDPPDPLVPPVIGKAILYARRAVIPEATARWLADDDVRDVPASGELIGPGRPICTIFASGPTVARCRAALVARARALYRALAPASRRIA